MMRKIEFLKAVFLSASVLWASMALGQTTGAQKLAAYQLQKQRIQQSPFRSIQWRLTGPNNRSGRSTDVAGITGNPNIIYAAYATSGLWKTTDGGETWNSLFDKEATLSIGNIALAHPIPISCM